MGNRARREEGARRKTRTEQEKQNRKKQCQGKKKKKTETCHGRKRIGRSAIVEEKTEIVYQGVGAKDDAESPIGTPSQIKAASEVGDILIMCLQKTSVLFHELLGESQRHFQEKKKQVVEGGLKKQTLKTKNKAFSFCNKMQSEEMRVELVSVLITDITAVGVNYTHCLMLKTCML